MRIVLFRVDDLVCGAPAGTVLEILPPQVATRVPGAHPAVRGIFNVRGRLLPLVDAGRALGREAVSGGSTVLLVAADQQIGVVVDEVLDLVTVPGDGLASREALPGIDPAAVSAVGRYGDAAFVLLDVEALFAPMLST